MPGIPGYPFVFSVNKHRKDFIIMKRRIRKTVAFLLLVVLVVGLFPAADPQPMKAATSSVSLANLGSLGSMTAGKKTKSGKWWMMKVGNKKAFCMNLGYTCHTGDVYRNDSATYISGDSGKKGRKAYIGYWYAETMHESRKAYVMAQALFWAVEEGDTSEAKLKAVISKIKSNTGYFDNKTAAELYDQIFGKSGTFSVQVTEWKYSGSGSHRQELLMIDAGNKVDPRSVSVDSFYRQRIRIRKVNEDGNPMKGAKFTIEAENIDELYSYNINGSASDAEEDISDFSIQTETDKDGWISLRLTYRLQTNDYFYLPDDDLATMNASAKKAMKDEWDDMGYHYADDLSEHGADQLLKRDMEKQITSIKNVYKIIETDPGNKSIVINPEYKDGKKIVIDLSNSWLREEWASAGTWGDIGITKKEWDEVPERPYDLEIQDNYKKVALSVKKRDSYSKDKKAHGDASLDGAVFGIYTDRQCTKKAVFYTESGRIYQGGNEFVTKNGEFETPYLRCGQSYYVKELRAPKGYKLKTDLSEITLDGGKYPNDVEYVPTKENLNVDNEPIRGKVALQKFFSDGQTGQIHPEVGARFQVYLRNKKGGYNSCDEYERDTLTIDENGYACSKELYFGDYIIHQIDSGGKDTEQVDDIYPVLINNSDELETKVFSMNNNLFKAYLRIIKKDGNTKKDVLKAGTTYQIYKVENGKETLVSQEYSNGNKKVTVDKFVTDASGQIMTYQALPSGTYRIYETDAATGYHISTPYIEAEINSKADNYKTETDKDGNTYSTVELEYVNQEAYGKLSLKKTGEQLMDFQDGKFIYEEKPLSGAIFEIYADEDIETQDGQGTHWFEKDDLAGTITTGKGATFTSECGGITGYDVDEEGTVTVKLPLGKYRILEKKTLYGYILPDKDWKVEFNWENKDTEAVLNSTGDTDENGRMNVKNLRAGTKIRLVKSDAQTKTGVAGAVFGVYTKDPVYNAEGKKITESDVLVGTMTTDEEGNAVCSTDLPLMSEGYHPGEEGPASGAAVAEPEETALNSGDYYLKEQAVSGSYYLDDKTEYPVHLEYKDQDTKAAEAQVTADNTQTKAVISKISLTNSEEIAGCSLQITDAEGNVILDWISGEKDSIKWNGKLESMGYRNVSAVIDEKGAVQVCGLLHDTTYTLTETRPADGYTTADSISFRLVQGENGQTLASILAGEETVPQKDNIIRMVDDVTKVEISKTDMAGSKEIPGCKLTITEKDSGKTVETWVSGKEPHRIDQKLTVGKTYILTEARPADGYATAENIEFTVDDTGEVQGVHMKDDTTKIRLIKTDGATGQGLPGAKFEVYDSRDKKVLSFTSKEEGYDITGKLAAGETYTFKEVEAPEGYRLAKPVKYTVKDTGKVQKVTVKDDRIPKPNVPQTGGTTPTVLLGMAVAAFAAASAGVAVRRRKRKK